MKNFGSLLLLLGIGSIVLNVVEYEFILLMWVDYWGETVGWAIRGGMIIVGAGLYFLSPSGEQEEDDVAEAE